MNYKRFRLFLLFPLVLIAAGVVFGCLCLRDDRVLAFVQLGVTAVMTVLYILWVVFSRRDMGHMLLHMSSKLNMAKKKSIFAFPLPVAVTDDKGNILLFNKGFDEKFLRTASADRGELGRLIPGITEVDIPENGLPIAYGERFFTAFYDETVHKDERMRIYYFVDDTSLKQTAQEYSLSRPYLLLLGIDGLTEIQKKYNGSDFAQIRMQLDQILGAFAASYSAVYDSVSSEVYMMITEQRHIERMQQEKFPVLSEVRALSYRGQNIGVTLSVGVSSGADFAACESGARQALDMAQSRGGDQVALRAQDGSYAFFGGIAKGIETTNKVRTRIVAASMAELIRSSRSVMLMGHRFPDLDAMGAAAALCSAVIRMGVPGYIVTDPDRSLAQPLLERLREDGMEDCLLLPQQALERIGKDTLLIVADTHIASFTECPELLEKASRVVVVDHHRKSVHFIDNAVLFFHDPAASSASEMVTELLQYLTDEPVIGKLEADALLSGIMLDTRNFVLRAGVRTFEAAAYLKARGADTVRVKKMFASSLESYKLRNSIVSAAESYKGCALSVAACSAPDLRIIASQAADELLNISDVDASFVLFAVGSGINISARSLGRINVQVVMEQLGGGGHQTMAACQLPDTEASSALQMLRQAIDRYYESIDTVVPE